MKRNSRSVTVQRAVGWCETVCQALNSPWSTFVERTTRSNHKSKNLNAKQIFAHVKREVLVDKGGNSRYRIMSVQLLYDV